jgi:hypothetical protein
VVDVRTLLIALVQDAENLARYLRHLGLPTEVPPLAPLSGARACPPCPCPTRLRRARRLSEGHRSGKAASSVGGVHDRRSDDPLPAAPLANAKTHPSALRRETRCRGTELAPGSRRDAAVFASWVALPGRRSQDRHRTRQAQRPFVSVMAPEVRRVRAGRSRAIRSTCHLRRRRSNRCRSCRKSVDRIRFRYR